jgi:hypothetical protein
MSIRFAQLVGIALLIALTTNVCCPSADAVPPGYYQVEACTEAVGYKNNSWTASTNDARLETHTSCGEPPAAYQSTAIANLEIADIIGLPEEIPVGAEGAWTFLAPAGTTIAEATGYASLYRNGGNGWQVYRQSEDTDGTVTVEQTCNEPYTESCGLGGIFQATALHARSLSFGAQCAAEEYEPSKFFTTCPDGALRHDVRAGIDYATVTLEDLTPPSNVMASSVPSGARHGNITIEGSATDTIAGLLSLSVINQAGQTVAGPVNVPGGCDYSQLNPCPTTASNLQISIETTTLPEGENQLRLEATNAAHDEATSTPFDIDVDNQPPSKGPEKPGTGGTGPGETGGTTHGQETGTGNPGDPSSSKEAATGSGSKTTPSKEPPPTLPIQLHTHLQHRWILINGTTPITAKGELSLKLTAKRSARHTWSAGRRVPLRDGHFTTRLQLPKRSCLRDVSLQVAYGGNRYFNETTKLNRLPALDCRQTISTRRPSQQLLVRLSLRASRGLAW